MQTFLPYPDFQKSAETLDRKRLGKQRLEAWQIYMTLTRGSGWRHHPAVKMWKGFEWQLLQYAMCMCQEWIRRGYKSTLHLKIEQEMNTFEYGKAMIGMPSWYGNELFHRSHRSNLSRKDPEHYSKYWTEPDNLPYYWPNEDL